MARVLAVRGFRAELRGTGESYQAVAAVTVVIVCAGIVLSATHWATENAREDALGQRARAQGAIFLDALEGDPALRGPSGALSWDGALRVAGGSAVLEFLPPSVKVVALREAIAGPEVLLVGGTANLPSDLVLVEKAVLVERPDGSLVPGIMRAGVELA